MPRKKRLDQLSFEEVTLIWKNFAGMKKPANPDGKRQFCVIIEDSAEAMRLLDLGWNVRERDPLDEGDDPFYYLSVKVKYGGWKDPRIFVVKKNQPLLPLGETTVAMLDASPLLYADVIINPSHWEMGGNEGVAAYLDTLYAVLDENEFDIKYAGTPTSTCVGVDCPNE